MAASRLSIPSAQQASDDGEPDMGAPTCGVRTASGPQSNMTWILDSGDSRPALSNSFCPVIDDGLSSGVSGCEPRADMVLTHDPNLWKVPLSAGWMVLGSLYWGRERSRG